MYSLYSKTLVKSEYIYIIETEGIFFDQTRMERIAALKIFTRKENSSSSSMAVKLVFSYSIFLLLCLVLGITLYRSSTQNARESFWQQHTVRLENNVAVMDNYLSYLDNYARQLINDSTFIRFANMNGLEDYGFVSTANKVKESLKTRVFSLAGFPVSESHIYMKKIGYIISGSQFTEVDRFYRDYRLFHMVAYDDWIKILTDATGEERNYDISAFTGIGGQYALVRNIDDLMPRSIPAVIWFEWDMGALARLFLPADYGDGTVLIARNDAGEQQLIVKAANADDALAPRLMAFSPAADAPQIGEMHVLSCRSPRTGWTYMLALPQALIAQELGNYDVLFGTIVGLALLLGVAVVVMIVRRNMRFIFSLDTQLQQAQGDKALLLEELDSRREDLCASYVRRILSGHVVSDQEFAYIMRYLRLSDAKQFLVLYGVVHSQLSSIPDPAVLHVLMEEALPEYLQGEYPVYYYTTLDQAYVLLMAYGQDADDPLMDAQKRVLRLHDHLTQEHSLWFYVGVGTLSAQPAMLWESYEQARTAARYTAKQHIFLPYEAIDKEEGSVYYPIEISAKLLHFISTGNRMQVSKMFDLIHRENIVDRSLPVNLLNFLLSDLKNTLLRVRFSVAAKTDAEMATLSHIDRRLAESPTFAQCESIALSLCDFFVETAEPSDPIPEVKAYLCENFADPSVCLSKLSDRFHISESYLSHLFKEKTGENFSVYLENLRLNEAVRRIRTMRGDKQQNLSMLYAELGYNNPTTFRRAFKKRYGITPSEMREDAGRKG